jgi:quinol monooxygenase YgiN
MRTIPLEFVTVEQWEDQAAADAHLATPHVVTQRSRGRASCWRKPP